MIDQQRPWRHAFATAIAAGLLLTGCGTQQPRPLNAAQAQTLAIMRFNNYNKGIVDLDITTSTPGFNFHAHAMVDMVKRVGYAEYTTTQPSGGAVINKGTLAWSDSLVEASDGGSLAQAASAESWSERQLTSQMATDLVLVMTLALGADRPENPALLQQSGARLLRTEKDSGGTVWVISGPGSAAADTGNNAAQTTGQSKTTYWIRTSGQLVKFEGELGGRPVVMTVAGPPGFPEKIPAAIYRYLRVKG